MSLHRWRLYADEEFDPCTKLGQIVADTEPEPVDHVFARDVSIYSGRGEPPVHPHIERIPCPHSLAPHDGCWWCCETGIVLRWIKVPPHLVTETVDGLRIIIAELEEPSLV